MAQCYFLGHGYISLLIRGARSTQDRRRILQGMIQKMKAMGFSVSEIDDDSNIKLGAICFSYLGSTAQVVHQKFDSIWPLFIGPYVVVSKSKSLEVFEVNSTVPDILNLNDE